MTEQLHNPNLMNILDRTPKRTRIIEFLATTQLPARRPPI